MLAGDFKTADVSKFWADGELRVVCHCPERHPVSYVGVCLFADSKMQLLKESVALDSISGKEYDVGFMSS